MSVAMSLRDLPSQQQPDPPSQQQPDNGEMQSGLANGPVAEFEAIYRAHCGFVWRNARRLGCDDDLADDVVHEVFLVVGRRLPEFRREASISTWLFAITYRIVHRLVRDRARHARWLRSYAAEREAQAMHLPHAQSDAGECLRHLLSHLDETKRVVFILAELEGMTSVEVGKCLGVKPPTVDSRLRAARLELARLIESERDREGSESR
jgi:RNA polymerase sigma-70 factor, ECF subfamily